MKLRHWVLATTVMMGMSGAGMAQEWQSHSLRNCAACSIHLGVARARLHNVRQQGVGSVKKCVC